KTGFELVSTLRLQGYANELETYSDHKTNDRCLLRFHAKLRRKDDPKNRPKDTRSQKKNHAGEAGLRTFFSERRVVRRRTTPSAPFQGGFAAFFLTAQPPLLTWEGSCRADM